MRESDFDRIVRRTIDNLPDDFRRRLENVVVTVQDKPTPELLEEVNGDDLLGVYLGVPLTERHFEESGLLPDQIVLFQQPLEEMCDTEEELADEIRVTVIHEVGHFFGLSEEEIEEALEAPRRSSWASSDQKMAGNPTPQIIPASSSTDPGRPDR